MTQEKGITLNAISNKGDRVGVMGKIKHLVLNAGVLIALKLFAHLDFRKEKMAGFRYLPKPEMAMVKKRQKERR